MTTHLARSYMDPNVIPEEVFYDEELLAYYSAPSPSKHQKHEGFDQEVYIGRIQRRTDLIEKLRNAYLRDVVAVKQFVGQQLTEPERQNAFKKWEESIPSLDLTQHFMLYSPPAQSIGVIPCAACGGSLEVIYHDNEKLTTLANSLEVVKEKARKKLDEFGVLVASRNLEIEKLENDKEMAERAHKSELKVLSLEMVDVKARLETLKKSNERFVHTTGTQKAEIMRLTRLSSQAASMEETLKKNDVELLELSKEVAQLRDALSREQERGVKMKESLKEYASNKEQLTGKYNELTDDVLDLRERLDRAEGRGDRLTVTVDSLEKSNHRLRHKLEASISQCVALEGEKKRLTKEVSSSAAQSTLARTEWAKEEAGLKRTIENLIHGQEALNVSLLKVKDLLNDTEFDNKKLIEKCKGHEMLNTQLEEDIRGLKNIVRKKDRNIESLEADACAAAKSMCLLERKLQNVTSDLNCSLDMTESLTTETAKLKYEIAAITIDNKKMHSRALKAESELGEITHKLNERIRMEEEKVARRALLRMKALERRAGALKSMKSPNVSPVLTESSSSEMSPAKVSRKLPERLPSLSRNFDRGDDRMTQKITTEPNGGGVAQEEHGGGSVGNNSCSREREEIVNSEPHSSIDCEAKSDQAIELKLPLVCQ